MLHKIQSILSEKKYFWLFAVSTIFFAVVLMFSWSLILYSNFYVREDLWTPLNLALLLLASILSALNITVSLYYSSQTSKKTRGFLAIFPAFFTTACPTCAPLFLSFWSAIATVWFLYLVNLRFYLILLSIFILVFSLWKMLNAKEICSIEPDKSLAGKG